MLFWLTCLPLLRSLVFRSLALSKERLETLWKVVSDHFELDDSVEVFYVMLAPNCERDEFKPPGGHESDCYFAPARIITKYEPSTSRKRRSHPVPARPPPSKKKCCKCRSGKCTNCQCVKKKRQCHPKCQCHLKGDQKGIEADTEE
eukprot:TRINITY_DN2349_c0_g1_i10.p1 TRINITY_DN2349_c0_g1~~TRINITY_DN2349_c0_g1_i10.p1  ORF type:complete len:146 (+),score=18.97 TRINITY_DN2349_c0_g1_i10:180-617(+)